MKEMRHENSCKVWIGIIVTVVILMGTHSAFASKGGNLKEKLATLRNWQLMDEFDLSPEKAQKVFSILSSFDDRRSELLVKRRGIVQDLKMMVDAKDANPEKLNTLMKKLSDTNVQLAKLPEEERLALSGLFSSVEQAHYLIFSERFARNIKGAIMNKHLKNGDRRGPAKHF